VLDAGADFGVVVAFGHIIRNHILDALPMVNIHFSLLPRWRGAAPLERAILAGDEMTGVCLMEVAEKLDEGDVYARTQVPVAEHTLDELRDALVEASCTLLVDELAAGLQPPVPQEGEPTYARKLHREDFLLDFTRPAIELVRVVRLGRAHTTLDGQRFAIKAAHVAPEASDSEPPVPGATVVEGQQPAAAPQPGTLDGIRVATGSGWLVLDTVQPSGKKPVSAADWQRGARLDDPTVLGT